MCPVEPSAPRASDIEGAPMERRPKPIEIRDDKVIIMGVELPRNKERGPKVPDSKMFETFSLDEFSLDLLQRIAKSISLNQPLLLEGDASVGKSHTIEYLADLCNQEVYRISLNGQTDVTDLIGKWVPNTETGQAEKELAVLLRFPERCTSDMARKMIEEKQAKVTPDAKKEAHEEGREAPVYSGFSKDEMMMIAQYEGISVKQSNWKWQDGDVPRQMKTGAWSVLDEVNTCEPQILVRLNAVLEKYGKLILHEDGSKEVERKPGFRMMATVNPPGDRYKGRIPLSAEWISRWNYQNTGELPEDIWVRRGFIDGGLPPEELDPSKFEERQLRIIAPEGVFENETLADYYEAEWIKELYTALGQFCYLLQKEIIKKQVAKDQKQIFDVNHQRDRVRFTEYLMKLRESGNMKAVIQDAVNFLFINKFASEADRAHARNVETLSDLTEPTETIPTDDQKALRGIQQTKVVLTGAGIPQDHLDVIKQMS